MKSTTAIELFRQLSEDYFGKKAMVIFTKQSRKPKPNAPKIKPETWLVTLSPGNAKRPLNPNNAFVGDVLVSHYMTSRPIVVDLFTNGEPVYDDKTKDQVGSIDNALDEMLEFVDFLNSEHVISWCNRYDVAISFEGEAQNLTGIVNDTSYEYRSRLTVLFYFTHKTAGNRAEPAD